MKTIKTKPTKKEPRTLSKIARLPKALMRKAVLETKEKVHNIAENKQKHQESPQQFATDKVMQKAEDVARHTGQTAKNGVRRLISKIRQKQKIKTDIKGASRSSFYSAEKNVKPNTPKQPSKAISPRVENTTVKNATEHTKNIIPKGKNTASVKRPVRTLRSLRSTTVNKTASTIKSTAKGVVKTTKKTVKSARMAVKTGTRAIKTTAQAAKMTARAAQVTARAAKVALQAAKAAAKAAITAIKLTIKAIIAGIKIAIAAIKALIAAIAAGGWIVVLIILIIAVIVMVIGTLFGVFFADEAQEGEPLKTAITQISEDFQTSIDNQISNIQDTVPHTNTKIIYTGSMDGDSDTVNNWSDVLAIYTVKTMYEGEETISITPEKQAFLLKVFDDMNNCKVTYDVTTEGIENVETEEVEEIVTLNIYIEVDSITAEECATKYDFNKEQLELLKELMSPAYNSYFAKITGIDIYGGETPEDLKDIISNLPANERAKIIIETAMSRLGDPYSQPKRGQGRYIDCSWLTYISYKAAGISIPTTSVEQAKYCYDNGYNIGQSELQPGDLVFWSKTTCGCGRWQEIHHVGIYLGNNQVIEASSSKGRVVIQELWGLNGGKWQVFSFARVM